MMGKGFQTPPSLMMPLELIDIYLTSKEQDILQTQAIGLKAPEEAFLYTLMLIGGVMANVLITGSTTE